MSQIPFRPAGGSRSDTMSWVQGIWLREFSRLRSDSVKGRGPGAEVHTLGQRYPRYLPSPSRLQQRNESSSA